MPELLKDMESAVPLIVEFTYRLLLVGGLFTLLFGILTLVAPDRAIGLGTRLNHWYSTRRGTRPLDVPRHIESTLYRHHRLVGGVVLLGSLFTLYQLRITHGLAELERFLALLGLPSPLLQPAAHALYALLLLGTVFTLTVGAIVFVRPSALKAFEERANRWVSARQLGAFMEQRYSQPDSFFQAHPRLLGTVITLGSIYLISIVALVL